MKHKTSFLIAKPKTIERRKFECIAVGLNIAGNTTNISEALSGGISSFHYGEVELVLSSNEDDEMDEEVDLINT